MPGRSAGSRTGRVTVISTTTRRPAGHGPQSRAGVLKVWRALADYPAPPEACLINLYDAMARMGLHQDRDEAALDAPVISISLGSTARFRVGRTRSGPTQSFVLESGDVLALSGPSRSPSMASSECSQAPVPYPLFRRASSGSTSPCGGSRLLLYRMPRSTASLGCNSISA